MDKRRTSSHRHDDSIWIAIDFETSGVNKYNCKIVGVGLQEFNIETGVLGLKQFQQDIIPEQIFDCPVVMHNAVFDYFLAEYRLGWKFKKPIHDTYFMAKHICNTWPAYDLKSLAWFQWGEIYPELLALKKWFRENSEDDDEDLMDLSKPPIELVKAYCLKDVQVTAGLATEYWKKVKDNYAYELDCATIKRTVRTTTRGIAVDLPFYQDFLRLGKRRIKYNKDMAGTRIGTDKNPMGNALREHLSEIGEKRKTLKGHVRADDVVLRDWKKKDKAIGSVGRVRTDTHTLSHFVKHVLAVSVPLKDTPSVGVFHPNLRQSAAITRRYTSKGFYGDDGSEAKGNTQNFPDEMREGIIAHPGYDFWKLDLASIEARMFSAYMEMLMGEHFFAEMYRKNPTFNPYVYVLRECAGVKDASKKHELYTPYKHGTLGRLYGSSPERFSIQLREDFEIDYDVDRCEDIYKSIDRRCPFIRKFQRFVTRIVETTGSISDPFGAIYYVPSTEFYKAVAYLCQGSAGNVLKWWWGEVDLPMQDAGDWIVNVVHDEFDTEILKGRGSKARVMGYCDALDKLDIFGIPIRAEASTGKNWKECG